MSTRATYEFRGRNLPIIAIYVHTDGYPEGAADKFFDAIRAQYRPEVQGKKIDLKQAPYLSNRYSCSGGWAAAFIRGNPEAEFTDSHEAHGDTEYRYTVHDGTISCKKRVDISGDEWEQFFAGDIADFVNRYTEDHNCVVGKHTYKDYGRTSVLRAPAQIALNLAKLALAYSDQFQVDNPNKEVFSERAHHWKEVAKDAVRLQKLRHKAVANTEAA